ncbi:MAG: (2Fe-2S)-binding protein [Synergistaceae bacterium]|nr:(2Fe-2S)-binding protein [Synergistaceae bacterium]
MLNWKDAPISRVICHCDGVTKEDIIFAINDGARSLEDIARMTGACRNSREKVNTCMNCRIDVQEMIDYYAAMADALRR